MNNDGQIFTERKLSSSIKTSRSDKAHGVDLMNKSREEVLVVIILLDLLSNSTIVGQNLVESESFFGNSQYCG